MIVGVVRGVLVVAIASEEARIPSEKRPSPTRQTSEV